MSAKEYIRKKLNGIREKISGVAFTYSYDAEIGYHVVYVEPSFVYNGNEDYKSLEMDMVSGFDEKFPYEDILVTDKIEYFDRSHVEFVLDTMSPEKYSAPAQWNIEIQSINANNSTYALAA